MGNNNLVVKNRIYSGVDLCKLISAVLVVLIHINETGTNLLLNTITSCISTIAVPFFFIVSGFFFANGLKKTNNKQKYFLSYEKKLIMLYLFLADNQFTFKYIDLCGKISPCRSN